MRRPVSFLFVVLVSITEAQQRPNVVRVPCNAQERLQASEDFRRCSAAALGQLLSHLETPLNSTGWTVVVCELLQAQVNRCGDASWPKCYSAREVLVLKAVQLQEQLEAVAKMGMVLTDIECPILRKPHRKKLLAVREMDYCSPEALERPNPELLTCFSQLHGLLLRTRVDVPLGNTRGMAVAAAAACHEFKEALSERCRQVLLTCVAETPVGEARFIRRTVAQKMKIPKAIMDAEMDLLRRCR